MVNKDVVELQKQRKKKLFWHFFRARSRNTKTLRNTKGWAKEKRSKSWEECSGCILNVGRESSRTETIDIARKSGGTQGKNCTVWSEENFLSTQPDRTVKLNISHEILRWKTEKKRIHRTKTNKMKSISQQKHVFNQPPTTILIYS